MSSFPLSDIGRVSAHPAKGMIWSKSAIIVKRLAYPKGAIPAHLKTYTEKFKAKVAEVCAVEMRAAAKGAPRIAAMNACIRREMKKA